MEVVARIAPEEAQRKVQSGEALLVCAYDDDQKFQAMHLDKALSLRQFREVQPTIPKDKMIVFYCA